MNDLSVVENRQVASADSVSTNIQVFNFEANDVRVIFKDNNEPLFCLSDIAKALKIKNGRDLIFITSYQAKEKRRVIIPTKWFSHYRDFVDR